MSTHVCTRITSSDKRLDWVDYEQSKMNEAFYLGEPYLFWRVALYKNGDFFFGLIMLGDSSLFDGFHLSNSIPIQDISVEIFMRIDPS